MEFRMALCMELLNLGTWDGLTASRIQHCPIKCDNAERVLQSLMDE